MPGIESIAEQVDILRSIGSDSDALEIGRMIIENQNLKITETGKAFLENDPEWIVLTGVEISHETEKAMNFYVAGWPYYMSFWCPKSVICWKDLPLGKVRVRRWFFEKDDLYRIFTIMNNPQFSKEKPNP